MVENKPNVMIILTDQQRYDTIAKAGYPHMITPNLDRLVDEGCLFTHGYTSNPVCMAARHDLLTGLPGRAHGYFGNTKSPMKDYNIPTIARSFSENNYRTASIGKMHFKPVRAHHGYNEMLLQEEIPSRWQDDQYATYLRQSGLAHIQNIHGVRSLLYHIPQNAQMDEAHHPNRWVADQTIDWLEKNGDNPFFLCCSWIHPHPPWSVPEEYQGLYKDRDIPLPSPISRSYPEAEEGSTWYGDADSAEEYRSLREAYYSCVTHVDHHIGRILDYLEEKQVIDNTLIFFVSDHGDMLRDKGYHEKCQPYDGASRIPFIVRYPKKVDRGTISSEFVDLMDIFPTCLELCALEYPQSKYELIGDSVFAANPKRSRKHQISSFGTGLVRWIMNRDKRYKYIYRYNQGTEEFYDMENDPQELTNLMGTDQVQQDVYNLLKSQAIDFERKWGPEGVIVDENFVALNGSRNKRGTGVKFGNTQMHVMDKRSPKERGEQFIQECEHAFRTDWNRGKPLTELFNESDYTEIFMKRWQEFAGDVDVKGRLFK